MQSKYLHQLSPLGFVLALSACGGGSDGNGSSINSTPTPPAASGTNADLVGTLKSETFYNDAVTGTANYPANGAGTANAVKAALNFSYDTASGTYTVSTAGRSQSFSSAQRDGTLSTAEFTVYKRTSGATTDTLALRNNSTERGTPSNPTFQYAGAGIWQRTNSSGSRIDASADAFTYGAATLASAIPTTGSASYAVSLNGIAAYADGSLAAKGNGTLDVNFTTGKLSGTGSISSYQANGSMVEQRLWGAGATITASSNSFGGSITLGSPGGGFPSNPGSLDGRFYGPNHEELGAAWSWRDSVLGTTFVGTMLGKDTNLLGSNAGLDALINNETFTTTGIDNKYLLNVGSGTYLGDYNFPSQGAYVKASYSEISRSLVLSDLFIDYPLASLTKNVSASDATYDIYTFNAKENGTLADVPTTIKLFRSGAGNPVLSLTYTSFGTWSSGAIAGRLQPEFSEKIFAFGRKTPADSMPRTGSATYSAIISGISAVPVTGGTRQPYTIDGAAAMSYDFAAASLAGSMHPFATDRDSGVRHDLGTYNFSNTIYGVVNGSVGSTMFGAQFDPTMLVVGVGGTPGSLQGQFTGPKAEEFFAQWSTGMRDPVNGNAIYMRGVMVGKKD